MSAWNLCLRSVDIWPPCLCNTKWGCNQNTVKRSVKLCTTFWISSSNTRLVFSLFPFISNIPSDAQISNLYLLDHSEVEKKTLQEFTSHLQVTSEINCAWRSGGRKTFLYKWNALRFPSTLHEQHHRRKTIFHTEGDEILQLWLEEMIEKGRVHSFWLKKKADCEFCHYDFLKWMSLPIIGWKPKQLKHNLKNIHILFFLMFLESTSEGETQQSERYCVAILEQSWQLAGMRIKRLILKFVYSMYIECIEYILD